MGEVWSAPGSRAGARPATASNLAVAAEDAYQLKGVWRYEE